MIGNSRLHWAVIKGDTFQSWNTSHLLPNEILSNATSPHTISPHTISPHTISFDTLLRSAAHELPDTIRSPFSLWVASVVPSQTAFWQAYPETRFITLEDIPLQGMYPSLGIDRALAVWGIADRFGLPALAIDAGTALTFTGADQTGNLMGGAILPGLGLQIRSLTEHTATLPNVATQTLQAQNAQNLQPLPRWARTTPEAITSGIIHTLTAGLQDFISDWLQTYPGSTVVMTGGDGLLLFQYLQQQFPKLAAQVNIDTNLVFWGMKAIVEP